MWMNYPVRRTIITALFLAGLSGPGWAQQPETTAPSKAVDPKAEAAVDLDAVAKRLRNYFTEEELHTLFDYLRDVSIAGLQGKSDEVLLPPDLAFKMAILQERMMREGQYQMQLMMKQLERDIDQALKDFFTLPLPADPKPSKPAPPPVSKPTPPAQPVNPYLQSPPQPAPEPVPPTPEPQRTGNPYLR